MKGLGCSIILFKFGQSNHLKFLKLWIYWRIRLDVSNLLCLFFDFDTLTLPISFTYICPPSSGRLLEHNRYPVSVAIYPLDAWLKEHLLWQPVMGGWEMLHRNCRGNRMVWVAPLGGETCFQSELCASAFPCSALHGALDHWGRGSRIGHVAADGKKSIRFPEVIWKLKAHTVFWTYVFIPIFLWCHAKRPLEWK